MQETKLTPRLFAPSWKPHLRQECVWRTSRGRQDAAPASAAECGSVSSRSPNRTCNPSLGAVSRLPWRTEPCLAPRMLFWCIAWAHTVAAYLYSTPCTHDDTMDIERHRPVLAMYTCPCRPSTHTVQDGAPDLSPECPGRALHLRHIYPVKRTRQGSSAREADRCKGVGAPPLALALASRQEAAH